MGELAYRYGVSRERVAQIFAIAAGAVFCGIPQPVALAQPVAPSAIVKCHPAVPKTGDVLIAGGSDNNDQITAAAEFFDPSTETFSTACNMTAPRYDPQALVVLSKPGKKPAGHILVLGGQTIKKGVPYYPILKTTDSWNPLTGKFQGGPKMEVGAEYGTLVGLNDGRSLVTVGETEVPAGPEQGNQVSSNLAMIYDPAKNKFTLLKNKMIASRSDAAAALISGCSCSNEGKVLIAGGLDIPESGGATVFASAELFDPATNSFAATGNMNAARLDATATSLSDGTILIAGGSDEDGLSRNSAEIYDPSSETFAFTANMNAYRELHTATRLEDGTVLIAGGFGYGVAGGSISSTEIYNPRSGAFVLTAQHMKSPRYGHSATLISGTSALAGQVLIAGGINVDAAYPPAFNITLDTAELFNPTEQTFTLTREKMLSAHFAHAAAQLP